MAYQTQCLKGQGVVLEWGYVMELLITESFCTSILYIGLFAYESNKI